MDISNAPDSPFSTWKSIPGYELLYEVSDLGQIRRTAPARGTWPGRILRHRRGNDGYVTVRLTDQHGKKTTKSIHRLVALAFFGEQAKTKQVNHIDGNKENPRLSNLQLVTPRENVRHARDVLGVRFHPVDPVRGERNGRAKLLAEEVELIRLIGNSMKQREIAAVFGVHRSQISRIQNNRLWKNP